MLKLKSRSPVVDSMDDPLPFHVPDNGIFPNSRYPVLIYKKAVAIPFLFPARAIKHLFRENGWTNNWVAGIFDFNHYHSNTHEAIGVIRGKTMLQLGGDNGVRLQIEAGDIIIIPAGVAHKNLGRAKDIECVGGYPGGVSYDMNFGHDGERPGTDKNIAAVPIPGSDPLTGKDESFHFFWQPRCLGNDTNVEIAPARQPEYP